MTTTHRTIVEQGKPQVPNFAFIDGQNVHQRLLELSWKLDWSRLRVYLREHYGVERAYYFLGYMVEHERLYTLLQDAGYVLIFKEVSTLPGGKPKGNIDAELVLQAMIDYSTYERAVVVTSDGDFACLVRHLYDNGKLERVLSASRRNCSALLKRAAREKIDFLEDARRKIG